MVSFLIPPNFNSKNLIPKAHAAGNTYYVDCNVGASGDGTTWAKAKKTINEGVALAHAGDTVNISAGTYPEYVQITTNAGSAGSPIIFQSSQDVGHVGTVTIDAGSTANYGMDVTKAYITVQGTSSNPLTIKNAPSGKYGIVVSGTANNFQAINILLQDCANGISINALTNELLQNFTIAGGSNSAGFVMTAGSTGTMLNCINRNSNLSSAPLPKLNGTWTINHSDFSTVTASYTLENMGTGTITITNSVFMGSDSSSQTIKNASTGSITLQNNIILPCKPNPSAGTTAGQQNSGTYLLGSGVTDLGGNIYADPHLTSYSHGGFVNFVVDDEDLTYAEQVAAIINPLGMYLTFFAIQGDGNPSNSGVTSQSNYQSRIQTLVNNGNEIADHTYSHSSLTATYAFTVTASGPSSSGATIQVDPTNDRIRLNDSYHGNQDINGYQEMEIGAVESAITAKSDSQVTWTVSNYSGMASEARGYSLNSLSATICTTATQIPLDLTTDGSKGFFKSEIFDTKAWWQSWLKDKNGNPYVVNAFAFPSDLSNATTRTAVENAGFTSARGTGSDGSPYVLSGIDMYGLLNYTYSYLQTPGYNATSSTSITIGTGSQTFTTQSGLSYSVGTRARVYAVSSPASYMEGAVTSYSGTTLVINVDTINGSGTYNNWSINLANDSLISRNMAAVDVVTAQQGNWTTILSHHTTELPLNEIQTIVNTVAASQSIVKNLTQSQIANTIKTSGLWSTSDNEEYTRTYSDSSNYQLLSNSPGVGAAIDGTDIGAYNTSPVLSEATPVPTPTNTATPSYTFSSNKTGTITYGGDCSSATPSAAAGNNTITFNSLADGTHSNCTITVTNGGNASTPLNVSTFVTDTTPPIASMCPNPLNPDGSNGWYVTDPSITLLATDLVSGVNAILFHWGSDSYSTYTVAFNAPEGDQTLHYYATDNAGNSSTPATSEVKTDTVPPVAFTPTANPASWTSANSVAISFSTTDATSGVANYKYKLDSGSYGSSVTSPYSLDVTSVADGTHTVTIKATDNAGNYREGTVSIYLDKTPPTVSAGADKTAGSAFARVGTAADVTSGIATIAWTKVSGPGIVTFTPADALSTTISANTDGAYVLRLTITDHAGNSAHSDMNLTWDTVHPIGSVVVSKNPVREGDSLTLTATFSKVMADNPVTQIAISGANTVPATDMTKVNTTHYTYTYTVGPGDGTAIVTLSTGTDLFGNVVISDPITGGTFTVDNTPPVPFTPTATPASWTSANSVAISFVTTDPSGIASYSIKLDSGGYLDNVTSPHTLDTSLVSDGTHTVTVKAIDNVGNYREESVTIYLDKTPPTASMCINPLNPDGANGWYVTNPSVTLLATDLVSGVNAILFHWDSGIDQTYTGSFNPPEGNNTLYYHAIDNAGNVSTTANQVVKVNTTPPSFSNLPGGNQPINLTDGQVITDAIYVIQVAPGDPIGIERVEFSVDDNLICNLSAPNTNGIYSCPWDTTKYHSTIKVTAYDLSGLTSTLTRTVITAWELPATGMSL